MISFRALTSRGKHLLIIGLDETDVSRLRGFEGVCLCNDPGTPDEVVVLVGSEEAILEKLGPLQLRIVGEVKRSGWLGKDRN